MEREEGGNETMGGGEQQRREVGSDIRVYATGLNMPVGYTQMMEVSEWRRGGQRICDAQRRRKLKKKDKINRFKNN